MKNSTYRKILEKKYVHRADVLRAVMGTHPNWESYQTRRVIHTDIPCRHSQTDQPILRYPQGRPVEDYESKLFCAPEADIQAGDIILLRKASGYEQRFVAGTPVWRNLEEVSTAADGTHMEVPLKKAETV